MDVIREMKRTGHVLKCFVSHGHASRGNVRLQRAVRVALFPLTRYLDLPPPAAGLSSLILCSFLMLFPLVVPDIVPSGSSSLRGLIWPANKVVPKANGNRGIIHLLVAPRKNRGRQERVKSTTLCCQHDFDLRTMFVVVCVADPCWSVRPACRSG